MINIDSVARVLGISAEEAREDFYLTTLWCERL